MPPRDYAAVRKHPQLSTAARNEVQLSKSTSYNVRARDDSSSRGKHLGQRDFMYWTGLLTQVILTGVPGLFLALAVATIILDKKAVLLTQNASQLERTVESAIKLSPTVFPIIFAAITGRFLRTLGLFLLNRRVRIGTLERLLGSQSFFASIERQFAMRGSYLLGLGITLIWLLSPVGGQSALRLLNSSPHTVSYNTTLRYEPVNGFNGSTIDGDSDRETTWPVYSSSYMTSLRTSQSLPDPSRDLFGNVRIPKPQVGSRENTSYVSLLGIPVADIPKAGNATFDITSQYFDVTCSDLVLLNDAYVNSSATISAIMKARGTFAMTTSLQGTDEDVPAGQMVHFNFTSVGEETSLVNGTTSTFWSLATCALVSRYVDSSIACVDGLCRVQAVRNSTIDTSQLQPMVPSTIMEMFMTIPIAASQQNFGSLASSITEWWIKDPTVNFAATFGLGFFKMYEVPLDTFTTNLGIIMNTFWQTTYCNDLLAGNFAPGQFYHVVSPDSNWTIPFSTTTASVTEVDGQQYICNKTFATILIIISILLLLEALVSLVLMSINIAPDTLGYVSSYTRDNAYFPNKEASHMDGLERSSDMRDVYAMLGDVRPDDEVGHIAFTSNINAQPLRKGRLYD